MICTREFPLLRPSHEAVCESRWVVLFILLDMCLSSAYLYANETNVGSCGNFTQWKGMDWTDILQRWKRWHGKVK